MSYSNSVWYEEIDRGLINLVKLTLGPKIPVIFTPDVNSTVLQEEKYAKVTYPHVRIIHLGETFDTNRYNKADVQESLDEKTGIATMSESAKPYTLSIQLELVTDKVKDSNTLTRMWCNKVLKHHNLDVIDTGGTPRKCYMYRTINTQIESKQNDMKVFRNIYKYKIWVELDEGETKEVQTFLTINLQ